MAAAADVSAVQVLASDGFTYERSALQQHIAVRGAVSPVTQQPLAGPLTPSFHMARIIHAAFPQLRCLAQTLPVELLLRILQHLSGPDLLACAAACSLWARIILHHDGLWHQLIVREHPGRLAAGFRFESAEHARHFYFAQLHGARATRRPRLHRRLPDRHDLTLYAN